VINNIDSTGLGRVQVRLPWLPEIEPWARVAVPMSGPNRGTYFIPQVGHEVLVSFNQGDISEAYVVGSLWNGQDRPPTSLPADPTEAVTKRIIRTPLGHEIVFDDRSQSIEIASNTRQKITIGPKKIKIETAGSTATVTLDQTGEITIEAQRSLALKAPSITIEGGTVDIQGSTSCNIDARLVKIN